MRAFAQSQSTAVSLHPFSSKAAIAFMWMFCLVLSMPNKGLAHSLNDSYLDLDINEEAVHGTLHIAIVDLEIATGLDSDGDTRVSWGEIKGNWEAVRRYVLSHVALDRSGSSCALALEDYGIMQRGKAPYLAMALTGSCDSKTGNIQLRYSPMFELDSSHRGFVSVKVDETSSTHVLNPNKTLLTLSQAGGSYVDTLLNFIKEGVWHIWIGIDHILFLVAMLLGVILYKKNSSVGRESSWLGLSLEILKLVTAFTVAHSVTLVLASLEWVSLPSTIVEASIALSVVVSGINILTPLFGKRHWQFAFLFGLIHGFGFANVLADLNLSTEQFLISLLGFNLGVELGQLVIVVLAVPVLALLSSQQHLRRISAIASGFVIVNIGLVWFVERSL